MPPVEFAISRYANTRVWEKSSRSPEPKELSAYAKYLRRARPFDASYSAKSQIQLGKRKMGERAELDGRMVFPEATVNNEGCSRAARYTREKHREREKLAEPGEFDVCSLDTEWLISRAAEFDCARPSLAIVGFSPRRAFYRDRSDGRAPDGTVQLHYWVCGLLFRGFRE